MILFIRKLTKSRFNHVRNKNMEYFKIPKSELFNLDNVIIDKDWNHYLNNMNNLDDACSNFMNELCGTMYVL